MDFQIEIHSLRMRYEHTEKGETILEIREEKECIQMTYHSPLEEGKKNSISEQKNPQIDEGQETNFTVINHQEELINEYAEWI